jgi:hypothetical protein
MPRPKKRTRDFDRSHLIAARKRAQRLATIARYTDSTIRDLASSLLAALLPETQKLLDASQGVRGEQKAKPRVA